MICGYAKREIGGDDASLGAFGDFRLKLIAREASAEGFVARRVPDREIETLEVYAGGAVVGAGEGASAFAKLASWLRQCGLGALSYEVDSEDEREALEAELESRAPAAGPAAIRGDGFARELSDGERREVEVLRAASGHSPFAEEA